MKAGVVSRTDTEAAFPVARKAVDHLLSKGVGVVVETETSMAMELDHETADLTDMDVDFVVAVGGDGTILRTAMGLGNPETPLLGVNMGRRGFLCEVHRDEVESAIDRIVAGRDHYSVEECSKLTSRCVGKTDAFPDALNEVLIASSLPSKMLLYRVSVDGEQLTEIQADGAIISTPTGSTAYNLSAGGSIIAPGVEAMMLTAVNPYSYFRSIALPIDAKVSIELLKPRADALAIVDGKVYTALKPLCTCTVEASPHKTNFIRFKPFYGRLRSRLAHLQAQ